MTFAQAAEVWSEAYKCEIDAVAAAGLRVYN